MDYVTLLAFSWTPCHFFGNVQTFVTDKLKNYHETVIGIDVSSFCADFIVRFRGVCKNVKCPLTRADWSVSTCQYRLKKVKEYKVLEYIYKYLIQIPLIFLNELLTISTAKTKEAKSKSDGSDGQPGTINSLKVTNLNISHKSFSLCSASLSQRRILSNVMNNHLKQLK